jgi:quercetin dioxygenase-like cupin family protein
MKENAMHVDVTTPATAESFWVVFDRLRLLGPVEGSNLHLIEAEVPPGSGTPPHTHASPETFCVIEGEITFRHFAAGGPPTVSVAGPGTTVRVGSHAPHNYVNESGQPARMLVALEQSMLDFFRDIGTPERAAAPDFARIGAAMERHGIAALEMAA